MTDEVPEVQVPPPTFTIAAEGVQARMIEGPVPMALVSFTGSGAVCNVAIPVSAIGTMQDLLKDLENEARRANTGIVTPSRRIVVPNGHKRRRG